MAATGDWRVWWIDPAESNRTVHNWNVYRAVRKTGGLGCARLHSARAAWGSSYRRTLTSAIMEEELFRVEGEFHHDELLSYRTGD